MNASSFDRQDVNEIKAAARGHWKSILTDVAGIPGELLTGRNCPCPKCGGTDRFRYIDPDDGAVFCNQCFKEKNGDGIATVRWMLGCDFKTACDRIREFLHLAPKRNGKPTRGTGPATNGKPAGKASGKTAVNGKPTGRIVANYDYHDEHGKLLYQVVRLDPKDFRQRRPEGKGSWNWSVKGTRQVPYRLSELLTAEPSQPVFIVEGEKDADALAAIGLAATTNAGGAGKWRDEFSEHLADRHVAIIPDNDEPGERHAESVARSLTGKAASVRVVRLPGLPDKGDVSDWLDSHEAAEPEDLRASLQALAAAADEWTPGGVSDDDTLSTSTDSTETAAPSEFVDVDTERWRPFPVECLPEPMASFVVSTAKSIGCDEAFVAVPLLAAVAAAIGTTRRLQIKRGWTEPPILWTAVAAESGSAKSPALDHALRPARSRQSAELRQYDEEFKAHQTAQKLYEKTLAAWKQDKKSDDPPPEGPTAPPRIRRTVDDTTIEALAPLMLQNPRGLLMARDELAAWFGSFDRYGKSKAAGDAPKWLEIHGGRSIIIDRKSGIPPTIHVPIAAVSIAGGIQPGVLRRVLTSEHRESGLAARLLFCQPPRRAKRWTEDDIDPAIEGAVNGLFDQLYSLQYEPGPDGEFRAVLVRMTPEAKAAWVQFFNEHAAQHAELSGDLAAAWSKLEGYAARLALVIHCVTHAGDDPHDKPAPLDAASITAGITLSRWFAHEARRLYGMLAETEGEREQRELADLIRRKGGRITPRVLARADRLYRAVDDAEDALQRLFDARLGRWESVPTATKSRREFVLFQPSTSTDSPESAEKTGIRGRGHSSDPENDAPEDHTPEDREVEFL